MVISKKVMWFVRRQWSIIIDKCMPDRQGQPVQRRRTAGARTRRKQRMNGRMNNLSSDRILAPSFPLPVSPLSFPLFPTNSTHNGFGFRS